MPNSNSRDPWSTPSALCLPPCPHMSLQPSSGWCSSRSTAALPGLEQSPRELLKVGILHRLLSHWPQNRSPAPRQAEAASHSPLRPALLVQPPLPLLRTAPVSGPVHPRSPLPRKPALASLTSQPSTAPRLRHPGGHSAPIKHLLTDPLPSSCGMNRGPPVSAVSQLCLAPPTPANPIVSPARAGGPCLLAHPGYLVPSLLPDTQWVPNKCETESPGP